MIEAAKSWLAPKHYSGLVSLSPADHLLIDTARAIRNYIAHESGNAYSEMNHKLKDVDCGVPNDGLGRGKNFIQDIGSFLKAYSGAERRVTRYLNRLDEIFSKECSWIVSMAFFAMRLTNRCSCPLRGRWNGACSLQFQAVLG